MVSTVYQVGELKCDECDDCSRLLIENCEVVYFYLKAFALKCCSGIYNPEVVCPTLGLLLQGPDFFLQVVLVSSDGLVIYLRYFANIINEFRIKVQLNPIFIVRVFKNMRKKNDGWHFLHDILRILLM